MVLPIEESRRADEKQQEQRNDDGWNDPFRGADTRHRMLLSEHAKACPNDWFLGGSARDPQSPVDAVAEHAVMEASLRLHRADSED